MDALPAARYSEEFKEQVVREVIEKERTISSVASYDLTRDSCGLPGGFRTRLVFLLQTAFVKFRSSRSTSFGVRYPRAE